MKHQTLLLLSICWCASALANPPDESLTHAPADVAHTEAAAVTPAPSVTCCSLPDGTIVDLEIVDVLNSSRQRRGDRFAIRVTVPVLVDGQTVIPAGTTGIGEVVHAAAARSGGAPGELLIAARTLDVGGQSVPLRGLKLARTGQDNTAMAIGASVAIGPFAMFIRGREIEIPASTEVVAKLAGDVVLSPAPHTDPVAPTPPLES